VGAGPAGLEAARVAAERGHSVEIHEAAAVIGGQFRLAGEQPRRAQITDLLDWYERQFDRLGVRLHLNSFLDAEDVRAIGADQVVLATGSLPDEDATQRWLPQLGPLPGLANGHVYAAEDVMRRDARLGHHVIVLDEGGNMRGVGTAWHLAEAGKQVTLVTPDPFVGKELARTSADIPIRARLARLGVQMLTEHGLMAWHGNGARLRNLLDGSEREIASSALVMATTNRAFDPLSEALSDLDPILIGDAQAPRQAPWAFYEGRKCGLDI
jgi:NADPH-dependent 2,4-dienoyl-CoA reductase/sulfur reductase-like enzyme